MKASSAVKFVSIKLPVLTKSITFATLLGLLSFTGMASAASQCKGLDSSACGATSACGWVESYQRKDGLEVKSFCRTSSKGKAKKAVDSAVSNASANTKDISSKPNG